MIVNIYLIYFLYNDAITPVSAYYGEISPTFQGVYEGSDVKITCASSTQPQWKKGDKNLPKQIRVEENAIYIYGVTEDDKGTYTCIGSFDEGKSFSVTSRIHVGSKLFF